MTNAKQPRFLIRFWGVRGSYPTPGAHTLRHGGNTACIEVQAGQHTIILDAGSGIIGLGNELLRRANGQHPDASPLNITLLLTHGHSDHLVGFPFFAPLFDPRTTLYLFGPRLGEQDIEAVVTPFVTPPYFPVDVHQLPSRRFFYTLQRGQRVSWLSGLEQPEVQTDNPELTDEEVRITPWFTHRHPLNGTALYRIDYAGHRIVYATDVEWRDDFDQEFLEFIEEADLLIHDAQYTQNDYQRNKQGFGHSTVEMATRVASSARVRELVLFHHEPTYDDNQLDTMEIEAQAHFQRTRSAYEGLEIDLLAEQGLRESL